MEFRFLHLLLPPDRSYSGSAVDFLISPRPVKFIRIYRPLTRSPGWWCHCLWSARHGLAIREIITHLLSLICKRRRWGGHVETVLARVQPRWWHPSNSSPSHVIQQSGSQGVPAAAWPYNWFIRKGAFCFCRAEYHKNATVISVCGTASLPPHREEWVNYSDKQPRHNTLLLAGAGQIFADRLKRMCVNPKHDRKNRQECPPRGV